MCWDGAWHAEQIMASNCNLKLYPSKLVKGMIERLRFQSISYILLFWELVKQLTECKTVRSVNWAGFGEVDLEIRDRESAREIAPWTSRPMLRLRNHRGHVNLEASFIINTY